MATEPVEVPRNTRPQADSQAAVGQDSQDSQTAQDFIQSQLQLEADAREALPYQFDTCTRPLGALRQSVFSCLTCNPPPSNPSSPYTSAGVCYSCSISCHGEHQLVELFGRRNFVCDCGTRRLPDTSPCSLRVNLQTGSKGQVRSEAPAAGNKYNHNFRNRFCGCGQLYDPHQEKGTMFQCLGLGNVEDGGCGEDWWHPECLLGLPRDWDKSGLHKSDDKHGVVNRGVKHQETGSPHVNGGNEQNGSSGGEEAEDDDPPLPPGFPPEDTFDHLICYRCVRAFPWIKRYANAPGFRSATFSKDSNSYIATKDSPHPEDTPTPLNGLADTSPSFAPNATTSKRKASDAFADDPPASPSKKPKALEDADIANAPHTQPTHASSPCTYNTLSPPPNPPTTLFLPSNFHPLLCRCPTHFPLLSPHPQLLEPEVNYSPPLSETSSAADGTPSVGSRSLLDRGEAALSNMDRVRAIEGVMAYNHVRDKVKDFLKPFAESGDVVAAEDVKRYFERLRGDEEGIRRAGAGGNGEGEDGEGGSRREQSGY